VGLEDVIKGNHAVCRIIRWNAERYGPFWARPDAAKDKEEPIRLLPFEIVVHGTLKQAENLAEIMSNYYAGMDYCYYVVGEDE